MKIKNQVPLQRLIGKIDNDFNISESDWIPRVAAWVIDALSQLKIAPMERKRRKLEVSNKIAQFPCELNATELKVFDERGCEIPNLSQHDSCGCSNTPQEIAVLDPTNKTGVNFMEVATIVDTRNKNYVLNGNQIELNFNANYVYAETYEIATYYDEYYECDVPYIYDNGLLLEALAWYCLFKYLSRGSKHQVYSLTSPNPVLNPWTQWNNIKYKAANSARKDIYTDKGWSNFFYNSTFNPRHNG